LQTKSGSRLRTDFPQYFYTRISIILLIKLLSTP
jgi:hypothetical protein